LLTAELGLGYVRDDLSTGETESNGKLRIGESWSRKMHDDTEVRQSIAFLSSIDDLSDFTSEFVLALTNRLRDRLSLTVKFVNSYDSRPVPGTERSDYTVATQLGYAFGE